MKQSTKESLAKEGWSQSSIKSAENIMEEADLTDKSKSSLHFNRLLYWTVIMSLLIGNFLVSMVLVPFLLVLNTLALDFAIVLLGLAFGGLFNILLKDIENIDRNQHLLAGVLLPITSLINISVMIRIANAFNDVLHIATPRSDTITISIIYVFAFSAPYLWTVLVKRE